MGELAGDGGWWRMLLELLGSSGRGEGADGDDDGVDAASLAHYPCIVNGPLGFSSLVSRCKEGMLEAATLLRSQQIMKSKRNQSSKSGGRLPKATMDLF